MYLYEHLSMDELCVKREPDRVSMSTFTTPFSFQHVCPLHGDIKPSAEWCGSKKASDSKQLTVSENGSSQQDQ